MMYGFAISLYNTTRWLYTSASNIMGRRITEIGDFRITENNQNLIIE